FIIHMLSDFPKVRKELPKAYQDIYESHYMKNREGETAATSVSQKMEKWLHKMVAADLNGKEDVSTLEIGAGTLNQLRYENTAPYDIIEPFKSLYDGSPLLPKVRNTFDDIDEIDSTHKYNRIISIATFEHICDLPQVVAKSCLLLANEGTLRVAIPNEGTILWTLGWKLTTGLEYKLKYGLDYKVLMEYEHVNTADEIELVLKHFYKNVKHKVFGLSRKLAFYRFYECSQPDVEKARAFLGQI
ncbi:MAG: hypothetical protein WD555_00985, partial [Fulvivirga sp.]